MVRKLDGLRSILQQLERTNSARPDTVFTRNIRPRDSCSSISSRARRARHDSKTQSTEHPSTCPSQIGHGHFYQANSGTKLHPRGITLFKDMHNMSTNEANTRGSRPREGNKSRPRLGP